MNAYTITHEQLESWFIYLAEKKPFYYPRKTEGVNYRFEKLAADESLDFQTYRPTILPPVKTLFPDGEVLFRFYQDEQGHYHFEQNTSISTQLLAGFRACDVKAIHLMDAVFADGIKDSHYLQRRQNTDIIAFNCLTPCDEHCFCEASGSLDFQEGADILITASGTQWLVESLTEKGQLLTASLQGEICDNADEMRQQALQNRPKPFGRQFVVPLEQVKEQINEKVASAVYEDYAQRCFSCGTCNLVCPTCYCFETSDELNLDGMSGSKSRHWDACMNPGFAEVAGGHNFRSEAADRQRHRLRRKFAYLPQRFAQTFCTGCGRCGRQCTTGIDIFDIVNDVCQSADNKE